MPVADPRSWSHLPFGDETAFVDFLGQHALFHRSLDATIRRLGGAPYNYLPIGDPGDPTLLLPQIQSAHDGASSALLIPAPPDLTAYDLTDADQFTTWIYLLSLDDVRLRQAAGI